MSVDEKHAGDENEHYGKRDVGHTVSHIDISSATAEGTEEEPTFKVVLLSDYDEDDDDDDDFDVWEDEAQRPASDPKREK